MKENSLAGNLVWIDLEMTGLDPDSDSILEIATIVTDADLNELAEGPVYPIRHETGVLERMDDWNRTHHGDSGLTERVRASTLDAAAAEAQTLAFLAEYVPAGSSPMAGNSICHDRRFMVLDLSLSFPHLKRKTVSLFETISMPFSKTTRRP